MAFTRVWLSGAQAGVVGTWTQICQASGREGMILEF